MAAFDKQLSKSAKAARLAAMASPLRQQDVENISIKVTHAFEF